MKRYCLRISNYVLFDGIQIVMYFISTNIILMYSSNVILKFE